VPRAALGSIGAELINEVRDAKVADLDVHAVGSPHDVGGLDVAVDDALEMNCGAEL
jgi:hypothetical protein